MKLSKSVAQLLTRTFKNLEGVPLRLVLVMPFVLEVFAAVGVVGYLSFKNGQLAVNDLAERLMDTSTSLVVKHLDSYLETPIKINEINLEAIDAGLLKLDDLTTAGYYFWQQLQTYNFSYINYTLTNGNFIGAGYLYENAPPVIEEVSKQTNRQNYTYITDSSGNRFKLKEVYEFNSLEEESYKETVKAQKPIWSKVYAWNNGNGGLSIAASRPIYDRQKRFLGVISIDLLLSNISNFLEKLTITKSATIFIIERNGLTIGSSTSEKPFINVNNKAKRLNILNSSNSLMRNTAKYLQEKFSSFKAIKNNQKFKVKIDNSYQFVRVNLWKDGYGLDWLVVTIVPEEDFMAQINANNKTTIIFCGIALLGAIALGSLASYWITQPILLLCQASQAIAKKDFHQKIEVRGIIELGQLSQFFNEMARQLETSFANLARTNQELDLKNQEFAKINDQLELRVGERTAELELAKNRAELANQAKNEFLANMSHELRTPLNIILGFGQLLAKDASLTEEQKENLGKIDRSSQHLLSLIDEILDLAKIESGKMTLNNKNFDLYALLALIEEMFALKAKSKNLLLVVEINKNVPQYINSDDKKLRQVLINLLGNAVKFTQQGTVNLKVSKSLSFPNIANREDKLIKLHFAVEDTGPGIPCEDMDRLFQAFFQTEIGKKSQQGTGLGLAIAKKFIELMGGTIEVTSQPGKGTIFQFDIEAIAKDNEKIIAEKPERKIIGIEGNAREYRILIVDDIAENRKLLIELLKPISFAIKEASNGEEAIEIWQQWQPHLIWMDMRMPVMNGQLATQAIKKEPKGKDTIIIALTASTFEEEKIQILASGCDDFVRKPIAESIVFDKIAKYLGVQYLYKDIARESEIEILTVRDLKIMPESWLLELVEVAAAINNKSLERLLAQIPEEHQNLAQFLQKEVNEFNFDRIMELAREVLKT
jgi:signal transduction histidine kinase/DNA-binding response OmpR family regulator